MTEQAHILTEEQWLHIKANDDARTQAAISASIEQAAALVANAEFLKAQVTPISHRDAIAVCAMQGLITGSNRFNLGSDDGFLEKRIAEQAFMLADAMIKMMEPKP